MKSLFLPRSFYTRDTQLVAKELLGKVLVRTWRGQIVMCRIVEVESYAGDDLASHASRGRTPRTEIMFGEAGRAYVYLIYGMYWCLNIVTEQSDFPAAILIRAAQPLQGIKVMQQARHRTEEIDLLSGPGKLCQALHVNGSLTNEDVTQSTRLYIVDDGYSVPRKHIASSPRIGVAYAGADALRPWRYYLRNNDFVSRK